MNSRGRVSRFEGHSLAEVAVIFKLACLTDAVTDTTSAENASPTSTIQTGTSFVSAQDASPAKKIKCQAHMKLPSPGSRAKLKNKEAAEDQQTRERESIRLERTACSVSFDFTSRRHSLERRIVQHQEGGLKIVECTAPTFEKQQPRLRRASHWSRTTSLSSADYVEREVQRILHCQREAMKKSESQTVLEIGHDKRMVSDQLITIDSCAVRRRKTSISASSVEGEALRTQPRFRADPTTRTTQSKPFGHREGPGNQRERN